MLSNGLGSRSKMETRGEKAGGLGDGKSLSRLGLEEEEEEVEGWRRSVRRVGVEEEEEEKERVD